MRKLTAYRYRLDDQVDWTLRHDRRLVMHRIECLGPVQTPDGEMLAVKITQRADLADPDNDVAAMVGQVIAYRKTGKPDPQSPELWFYDDKFWVKARGSGGTVYYNNKQYLIYEIAVRDRDRLISEIVTGFERD